MSRERSFRPPSISPLVTLPSLRASSCRSGLLLAGATLLLLLLLLALPVGAVSSLPLLSVSVPAHSMSQPFALVPFPADANTVVLGVTVQVPVEDCDQSSRWTFRQPELLSPGFNYSMDRRVCAVFIYPANSASVVTIRTFTVEIRKLWYYNNRAAPTSPLSPLIRLAWNYWITHRYLVSDATYQHVYYCLPEQGAFLAYFDAASTCNLWMQDPTDPTATGATLACPYSPMVEWLIDHQRTTYSKVETDVLSGQTIGHVTYIGLFGNRPQWDNGRTVTYTNWATSNPTGAFPSVLDQFSSWKSVVTQESHAYCCESSGIGSTQAMQNGMVTTVPLGTSASTAAVVQWTMDYTSPRQFPFAFVSFESAVSYAGLVTSFVAGIHQEDCDGSLRFLVDDSVIASLQAAGLDAQFDVQLCSIRFQTRGSAGVNASVILPFVLQVRLMVISAVDIATLAIGEDIVSSTPVRLLWGFTFGDNTSWVIGHHPLPHFYQCFFDAKTYDEADDACAELSGGLNEAYMLTVQHAWEQDLMQKLRARVALNDDVWFGIDRLRGDAVCANGDALSYNNWAVNQPSSLKLPAKASASDGKWFSTSRESSGSFCCEWTATPSRGLSGALNVSRRVLSLGIPHKQTSIGYKPYQSLRPFRNLSAFVYPELARASRVFGVTMQLSAKDCSGGRGYQLWAPPGVIRNGFIFCPSAASGCDRQVLLQSCMWYLSASNRSAVPVAAYLSMMSDLVLNISVKIPYAGSVPFGWAFWANTTLALGPVVISASTGIQYACSDPNLQVSFTGGMEQCRFWHGDGFLASVLSAEEQGLLELARRIANGFSTSFGRNAWIGLERNSSLWSNGDPNVFQMWAPGQPDKTGPTQSGSTGAWTNVPHALQTALPMASFCCKRNGFNQLTSVFGGVVWMRGPTYSTTVSSTELSSGTGSRSGPSETEEGTRTRTTAETPSLPLSSDSSSFSASITRGGGSRSLSLLLTTSVPKTTPPVTTSISEPMSMTKTLSDSFSAAAASVTDSTSIILSPTRKTSSATLTDSVPLPPLARLELVNPSNLLFTPEHVRSGAIRITVEGVFVQFISPKTSNTFWDGGVTLSLDRSSPSANATGQYFTFSTVDGVFLSPASFSVDPSLAFLTVQVLAVQAYDPPTTEVLLLTINRNVTNILPGYPPESFPPLIITIAAETLEPSTAAKVASTALGALALGAPAAFRDQQVLYLLGRHHCAKPYMRSVFLSGERVVSPASWRDTYQSQWTGAAVIVGAAIIVNFAVLARAVSTTTARSAGSVLSRGFFPSIAVLGSMWMHVAVTFFSIRLVQRNAKPTPDQNFAEVILGGIGVGYSGLLTVGILVWSWIAAPSMVFEVYDEAALHHVHWFHRPFLPFGRWASADHRDGLRWIAGEYRYVQYAGAEWLFGWLFTWFVSFRPDSPSDCFSLFFALGFGAFVLALIVGIVRPFRSSFMNVCSAASFLCLCVILCLSASQLKDPDGPSRSAQLVFRWTLVVVTVCRSAGNIIFLFFESKLISPELDSFEKERWRQMHALKKNSVIFQSRWLKQAHDEAAELREQEAMAREMESLQRFRSVAFDTNVPLPSSRRDTVRIEPGYRFPTSFRKTDPAALVEEDFPDKEKQRQQKISVYGDDDDTLALPPLPAREYSFPSGSPRRSLSRQLSQHKKFSVQYVESDGGSSEDDDDDSEELYDPFAEAAAPRQGMYKNSLLYRADSNANAGVQGGGPARSMAPSHSPRGPSRVSFYDPASRRRSSNSGERQRQPRQESRRRQSSVDTYDPFAANREGSTTLAERGGSRNHLRPSSTPLAGSSSPRPDSRRSSAASVRVAREDSAARLSRSRWDSTVRQMLQQRASSILELDDDDDDL